MSKGSIFIPFFLGIDESRSVLDLGSEVAMIVDLGGKIKQSSGSLSVMRQILSSCQSNYPERLRWCVVRNIPLLSRVLINLMWPFIE